MGKLGAKGGSAANPDWIVVPLVGGFIGWVTNYVAIRMLFRPRDPWRLPGLDITFQGVIPRRRGELARSLGATVERDLLSIDAIIERFLGPQTRQRVAEMVTQRVVNRLHEGVRFLPPGLLVPLLHYVANATRREAVALLEQSLEPLKAELRERLQLSQMVEERLLAFSLDELERLVVSLTARELRHIELLGGLLGLVIGLVQVAVVRLWHR